MKTLVALFRGINVGGNHILPMAGLKQLLAEVGCTDVRTYIQSGNAIFDYAGPVADLTRAINEKVQKNYGFSPTVMILKKTELHQVMKDSPFTTTDGKSLHVYFMSKIAQMPDIERLKTLRSESEQFALIAKAFYLLAPEGVGRSKLAANVEKCLGVPVTARNWNTIGKLAGM
jgi:uncharacterized protein (DUF1697 family)